MRKTLDTTDWWWHGFASQKINTRVIVGYDHLLLCIPRRIKLSDSNHTRLSEGKHTVDMEWPADDDTELLDLCRNNKYLHDIVVNPYLDRIEEEVRDAGNQIWYDLADIHQSGHVPLPALDFSLFDGSVAVSSHSKLPAREQLYAYSDSITTILSLIGKSEFTVDEVKAVLRQIHQPGIHAMTCEFSSLVSAMTTMFLRDLDGGGEFRICKHCGKVFLTANRKCLFCPRGKEVDGYQPPSCSKRYYQKRRKAEG